MLRAENDRSPISGAGYVGSANRETMVWEWADMKQENIYHNSEIMSCSPFVCTLLIF